MAIRGTSHTITVEMTITHIDHQGDVTTRSEMVTYPTSGDNPALVANDIGNRVGDFIQTKVWDGMLAEL